MKFGDSIILITLTLLGFWIPIMKGNNSVADTQKKLPYSKRVLFPAILSDSTTVTNTHDSGPGSLRNALNYSNTHVGPDTIRFDIPGMPPHVIKPLPALDSNLPEITDDGTVIDGTSQPPNGYTGNSPLIILDGSLSLNFGSYCFVIKGDHCEIYGLFIKNFNLSALKLVGSNFRVGKPGKGNVISNNFVKAFNMVWGGISVWPSEGVFGGKIQSNFIGVDPSGTVNMGNFGSGIILRTGELNGLMIGGDSPGEGNIISGNAHYGVQIESDQIFNVKIQGNIIGMDVSGTTPMGNGLGGIFMGGDSCVIGGYSSSEKNIIGYNGPAAIHITTAAQHNRILQNEIFCQDDGIVFEPLANRNKQTPVIIESLLDSITGISQPFDSVEIFISDNTDCPTAGCQGRYFLGKVQTKADGSWKLFPPYAYSLNPEDMVTATATDVSNNTSEFAVCISTGSCKAERTTVFTTFPLRFCTTDPDLETYFFDTGTQTSVGVDYKYIITDTLDSVVVVPLFNAFDFEQLPVGTYRVYGLSYSGDLDAISAGQPLSKINSTLCDTLSDNFLEVRVATPPDARILSPPPPSFCLEDEFLLYANQGAGLAYQWNLNGVPISGATEFSYLTQHPGEYTVTVVSDGCDSTSQSFFLRRGTYPIIDLGVDTVLCDGANLILDAAVSNGDYLWSTAATSPTINVSSPGLYHVEVDNGSECLGRDSIFIQTGMSPALNLPESVAICNGEAINIRPEGNFATYQWSTGDSLNQIMISQAGTYSLMVSDSLGCGIDIDEIEVREQDLTLDLGGDKAIFLGDSILLVPQISISSGEISQYDWRPAIGLSCSSCHSPKASPSQTTDYLLTISSDLACSQNDTIRINIYKNPETLLDIPNIFSPNNDGFNENWEITGLELFPEHELVIFNRLGREVFRASPYLNNWNGMFKGNPLPVNTYYFVLNLKKDLPPIKKTISIIR